MGKIVKKLVLFLVVLLGVVSLCRVVLEVRADWMEVTGFAKHIYEVALERKFNETVVGEWFVEMINEDLDCAAITSRILKSKDFIGLGLTDRDYVTRLYRTILEREPEPEEKQNWVNTMKMGKSRDFVLQQFVNSEYFTVLADRYDLERGALHEDGRAVNIGVCRFINRLYPIVLERKYDTWGYCTWALIISDWNYTLEELARAFFDTEKYVSRNTTNEEYVGHLYQVFFDRVPEVAEVVSWCDVIEAGATRLEVLLCFSRSDEFAELLESYGQPAPVGWE